MSGQKELFDKLPDQPPIITTITSGEHYPGEAFGDMGVALPDWVFEAGLVKMGARVKVEFLPEEVQVEKSCFNCGNKDNKPDCTPLPCFKYEFWEPEK